MFLTTHQRIESIQYDADVAIKGAIRETSKKRPCQKLSNLALSQSQGDRFENYRVFVVIKNEEPSFKYTRRSS